MRTGPETAAVAPELVTLIEAMCASPAEAVRTRSVLLSSLMAFGSARGITSTAELFDRDVIEAFCLRGCGHLDVRTRATYRWVCRRLAEEIVGDSDDDR